MQRETKRNVSLVATIGAAFILFAVVGGAITTRHMNKTADEHGMSAGRPGDALPNRINDQSAASAKGATTGSNSDSAVPPGGK
jgi:hypothetical protein